MMRRRIARYGWRRDIPDMRDFKFAKRAPLGPIASSSDLRTNIPIYDQLQTGSCTGNSSCRVVQFVRRKEGLTDFIPARLMAYYDARVLEGNPGDDSGAQLRDVFKCLATQGVCDEKLWPFAEKWVTVKPPDTAYAAALTDLTIEYHSLNIDLDEMRACLSEGYPYAFGFTVYQSFEDDVGSDGMMPMPDYDHESVVGAHAVCAMGHSDKSRIIIVDNSWGPDWGDKGSFYMPYDYISNPQLAADPWTIRRISSGVPAA